MTTKAIAKVLAYVEQGGAPSAADIERAQAELMAIRAAAKAIQKWGAGPIFGNATAEDVDPYDAATDLLAAIAKEETP